MVAQNPDRAVALIEQSLLLPNTEFFSRLVQDDTASRDNWFGDLLQQSSQFDLVFLDPDNGIEVKSRPYGGSMSSKYVFKREIERLWKSGKWLLIYQHFIREKRELFIDGLLEDLAELTSGASLAAFTTSHVVFFMLLQPRHAHHADSIAGEINQSWSGQINLHG